MRVTFIFAKHWLGSRGCVFLRFSLEMSSLRVLDSLCFKKRQAKTVHSSPFASRLEPHRVQMFETRGHHSSSNSLVETSNCSRTLNRRARFSPCVIACDSIRRAYGVKDPPFLSPIYAT